MVTNCIPLVADLVLFCYGMVMRGFMLFLLYNKQADVIEVFNSTSRYLDDLLYIDSPYCKQMESHIYPTDLELNKASYFDTKK